MTLWSVRAIYSDNGRAQSLRPEHVAKDSFDVASADHDVCQEGDRNVVANAIVAR